MKADTIIRTEGTKELRNQLGVVEAERFITLIRRDNFDYTEWQRDLWPDKGVDEIFAAAKEFSKKSINRNNKERSTTTPKTSLARKRKVARTRND